MRPFSFGKATVKKISFNQNIKKLTFAIPIFAIFIAIPSLLFFNYRTYKQEVGNLTEKLIRDSREDVANHVNVLYRQISTQKPLLDSILKNTLNRQSQEIQLIEEQLQGNSYTKCQATTLSNLISHRVAVRENIQIALFDTTGALIQSDSIAEKNNLFKPLSSGINFYKEDHHTLLTPQTTPSTPSIIHYTIHSIPNSKYLIVSAITQENKQHFIKEMTLKNTLSPILQNNQDLTFVLDSKGTILLSNKENRELNQIRTKSNIEQILEFPQGLHIVKKSLNNSPHAILFTVYLEDYDWILGSSINLDPLQSIFISARKKMLWHFLNQFLIMSSVVLLMMLLSMWYGKRLSLRITNQFSAFMNSFYSLIKNRRSSPENTFLYEEFDDIIKLVIDLTQDLKKSEKRFRDMAELLPVLLFECDNTGLLTYVNSATEEMFDYKISEVINRYTFDFFTTEDKEKLIENIEHRARGSVDNKPRRYTARKKGGELFDVMIHANNIVNNGKKVGIRGIITDISDQVKNEKCLQEMYEESETLNRLMAKREKRVFEMKLEVNTLLKEMGKPIKYMATENIYREEHVQG